MIVLEHFDQRLNRDKISLVNLLNLMEPSIRFDMDDFNTTIDSLPVRPHRNALKEHSKSFIIEEESKSYLSKSTARRWAPEENEEKPRQFSILLENESSIPIKK